MARVLINESNLENIADAIRDKNGSSDTYLPSQMASAINSLPSEDYIQHSDIPSYVKDSVADIVANVKAVQSTANTFTFIAGSDAHQWDNANVTNGNLHAGMAMKAGTQKALSQSQPVVPSMSMISVIFSRLLKNR